MKKLIFRILSCATLLLPMMTMASAPKAFLSHEFNMSQFHQCRRIIKTCPVLGPFRNARCVKNKINHYAACDQLMKLSDESGVNAFFIDAKKFNRLTLVSFYYPADGQFLYSVITSDGRLINLNQDIRKGVFETVIRKPIYRKWRLGKQTFLVRVRLTEKCLACRVVGYANLFYHFNSEGKYIGMHFYQIPVNKK